MNSAKLALGASNKNRRKYFLYSMKLMLENNTLVMSYRKIKEILTIIYS